MKAKVFIFALLSVFLLSSCEQQQPLQQHRTKAEIFHKFDPDQPRVEEPFVITLTAPTDVQLENGKIEGISMYMGSIPLVIEQITASEWQAQVWLGACSDPQMQWQVTVPWYNTATSARGVYVFQFMTETN
ncbi:hypothetical protein SAMN04488070_0547 [Pseudidiomarina maritima]|jgi:hypothetical protein|uniref:Uncharacterized protein n=1 Tax=Pseudidiomarina maritima TaxID=519453 RepID=A0A1I6GE00_9GAMM|nr:hypothetical protein [Pseudidiomarina maritima]SFR40422.1 hypothetical protein SAMN04488070_0547 [Pseudidiomarina maritima]